MSKIDILAKLDQTEEIFSLPQTLLEVLEAVESEEWTAQSIAEIISKDPGITTRILKMANSSYYSMETEISTLNRAIMVLGASMVKCLALSAVIFNPPKDVKDKFDFDMKALYNHFLSTAIAAQQISENVKGVKPEEAFTAGLLHDIGMIFILKVAPLEYNEILRQHEYGRELIELEREKFGTDHAEIGYLISRKWKLPSALQNAIGEHHRLLESENYKEFNSLGKIVALANLINRHVFSCGANSIEETIKAISGLVADLGLDHEIIQKINEKNLQETFKAAENIGIDVGEPFELLEKANRQILNSYLTIEMLFKERQELSKQILEEEHKQGALKSKNIAVATLSHYINNAATAISGRIQIIEMLINKNQIVDSSNKLPAALEVIDRALSKILAVMAELKSLTSLEDAEFYKDSSTINIDDSINERMKSMSSA